MSNKGKLRLLGYLTPVITALVIIVWLRPHSITMLVGTLPLLACSFAVPLLVFTHARADQRTQRVRPAQMMPSTEVTGSNQAEAAYSGPEGVCSLEDFLRAQP